MDPASTKSGLGELTARWLDNVGLAVAVGSFYFLVAYLSLRGVFFLASEGITLFWAAAGISSGLLIGLGSPRRWPVVAGIFLGAFAIPFFVLERGIWLATIFALCDTAEPLIVAGLIARYFGADFALDRLRRVFGLLGATIAGTAPSSLAGAAASRLFLGAAAPILSTWLHWWTGVAVGVVTLAPLIIGLLAARRDPLPRSEQIEGGAGLLTLAAMTAIVITLPKLLWETVVPGALLFPPLLWLAARCRPVFAAGGVLMVSLTLAWTTSFDIGHLGNTALPTNYRILQAQAIILVVAVGTEVLAALFAERREGEAHLARSIAMLERARVAHELHDTLLQTIQGSKFLAEAALFDPSSDPARLRNALEKVTNGLTQATQEGRAALNSLRASTTQTNDLVEAFRYALEGCQKPTSLQAALHLSGEARDMHPVARDEVYRIGYEAIRNACAHSQASRLDVALTYTRDLVLRVSDNGIGMDPVVAENGRDGHFGVHCMRERATRIGGKLTLTSSQGAGTEMVLLIPGRNIFRNPGASVLGRLRSLMKGQNRDSGPA